MIKFLTLNYEDTSIAFAIQFGTLPWRLRVGFWLSWNRWKDSHLVTHRYWRERGSWSIKLGPLAAAISHKGEPA